MRDGRFATASGGLLNAPTLLLFTAALATPALASAAPAEGEATGEGEASLDLGGSTDAGGEAEAEAEPADDGGGEKKEKKKKGKKKKGKKKKGKEDNGPSDMKMRFGLGAQKTLGGINALNGRLYVTDKIHIGVHAGYASFHYGEEDQDGEFTARRTVGFVGAGLELFYWPLQGKRGNIVYADVGIGARGTGYFGLNRTTAEEEDDMQPDTIDEPMEFDIEIPVAAQVWFGRKVSVIPEFGFLVRIVPGTREVDDDGNFDENPGTGAGSRLGGTDGPGVGFELGNGSTGMFLGLSVNYWFG